MGDKTEIESMITLPVVRIEVTLEPMNGGEYIRSAVACKKPSPSMGECWVGVWPLRLGMNAGGRRRPTAPDRPLSGHTPNPALPPSRGKGSEWVPAATAAPLPLGNLGKSA
jgi:hypothetical protein